LSSNFEENALKYTEHLCKIFVAKGPVQKSYCVLCKNWFFLTVACSKGRLIKYYITLSYSFCLIDFKFSEPKHGVNNICINFCCKNYD